MSNALLALADGRVFHGVSFGATGTICAEICFNTSLTGYQEVITDPSYCGQIVAMTAPQIGNTGVNSVDAEARRPFLRGFVIEELTELPSSWRSEQNLSGYLSEHGVLGIAEIDTRALTRHLREKGAMSACLTTELSAQEAITKAQQDVGVLKQDFVKEVTTDTAYTWGESEEHGRAWTIPNPTSPQERLTHAGESWLPLDAPKYRIVAYDLGIKTNILRLLRAEGFIVEVVPARTSAEQVLAMQPQGVFLSNGPGDPAALGYISEQIAQLIGKVPLFGICLGHQMLAHALGGSTYKLKFGHRGGNQPVQDLRTGKVAITSQNHGFAVDQGSLPEEVEVTHINLNDGTVEGLRHKSLPLFSVQYHPEAAPGPHDAEYFFAEFAALIEENAAAASK